MIGERGWDAVVMHGFSLLDPDKPRDPAKLVATSKQMTDVLRGKNPGVADPNPYDGIEAGKMNLWTYDSYHASRHGSYLEALVIFGSVTGRDPRSLGDNECSAFELGLSRTEVKALQQVA